MYAGRVVAVGKTSAPFVCYRVSSNSFPDRAAKISRGKVKISLKPGIKTSNQYVEYNCIAKVGKAVIASNGKHTDLIAKNFSSGMPMKEAIYSALSRMGYEKDGHNTPRIAGAFLGSKGYLGIIRKGGIEIQEFPLRAGSCRIVSTNSFTSLSENEYAFEAADAKDCARFISEGHFFCKLKSFVCSAAYLGGYSTYNPNVPTPAQALALLKKAGCSQKVILHCKTVRRIALKLLDKYRIKADRQLVETGSLLHDIGRAKDHGIQHGLYSYQALRELDLPLEICLIALHHVGSGIDRQTAVELGLPPADYSPITTEEKLVCFADILARGDTELSYEEALEADSLKFGKNSKYIRKMKALHCELTGK
ncbi:MAG: IMP cyclohydrolase [archaeon]